MLKNSIAAYFSAIEIHNKPNFSHRYETPNAQKVNLSDDKIVRIYPYTYREICERCIAEIPNFKQGKKFNSIMSSLKGNNAFAYTRKLNPPKAKSTKTVLYSPKIIDEIKHQYEA